MGCIISLVDTIPIFQGTPGIQYDLSNEVHMLSELLTKPLAIVIVEILD